MADLKFFKKSTKTYDDEKIRIIESMPEADAILVIWDKLLCLAGKTNDGGWVHMSDGAPYSEEMLATLFNRPLNTVRLALRTLDGFRMISNNGDGVFINNWPKWQDIDALERIRAGSRRRMQAYRDRLKLPTGSNVTVTSRYAIEEEEEEDKEEEKDNIHKLIKEGKLKNVFINAQSLERIVMILKGETEARESIKAMYQRELEKLGVTLQELGIEDVKM